MKFEQVDSTLMGDRAAFYLTEPVQLKLGAHRDTIRFMVTPKMAEDMILGLAWLAKWGLQIYWAKTSKQVVMRKQNPSPPAKGREKPK